MDDDELGVFASPGDELGDANNKSSGPGTYVSADGSRILSSLCGRVREHQSMISVSRSTMNRLATLPFVGAEIYGVVTRISSLMATVDILVVDGKPLAEPSIAIIRKENVREAEIDKVYLQPASFVLAYTLRWLHCRITLFIASLVAR